MAFNSKEYRFANVAVSAFGTTFQGLRGVSYKKKQEKELLHAQGDKPIGIQRGNISYEGELKILKSDFDALNEAAVAAGYEDLIEMPGFPIIVSYTNDTKIKVDTLLNVEFTEFDEGLTQGDKFKELSLPIIFTGVKKA
jgi:hypothetical protein